MLNQQETDSAYNSDKGSSETTRVKSVYAWMGGIIDGDGCFLVSKQGYTSCEITMSIQDEFPLSVFKTSFGGSLKPRSGMKAIRYRLHHTTGMILLVNSIMPFINNPIRIQQLQKVCFALSIPYIPPIHLSPKSSWFAGFWDADGTITLNSTGQITISVTNKYAYLPQLYATHFGGACYFDKAQNGYWKWQVQSRANSYSMANTLISLGAKSYKINRLRLVPSIVDSLNKKYHLSSVNSLQYKSWLFLYNKFQYQ